MLPQDKQSCRLKSLTEVWLTMTIHLSFIRHDCQNNFPLKEKLLHTYLK